MANEKLLRGLSIFASGYVKRWMETNYDALMRTVPARKLMEADAATRYAIEASLYALLAYAEQHCSADTPLRALLCGVAMDAPSEISMRIVNGFRDQVLSRSPAEPSEASYQTKSIEQVLLQLDDQTLASLLAWLVEVSPESRMRIQSLMETLSDEELHKALGLTPEGLKALACFSAPPAKPSSRLCRAIRDEVQQAHRRIDEQLAELRWREQR
jgi:hypothetical protein